MAPNRIQSIERAAAVLQLLSGRARRLGVVELAGQPNLPSSYLDGNELRTRAHSSDTLASCSGESVLLAETPDALVDEELARFTPTTITEPDVLRAELRQVRERGWATDHEELVEGEVSYAAAIRDRRGSLEGAIGISGPVERLLRDGDVGAIPW